MSRRRIAKQIIIFGRGLDVRGDGYVLSRPAQVRVETAVSYISQQVTADSSYRAKLICSGGWAGAAANMSAPPDHYREGRLMADYARELIRDQGIENKACIIIEDESDSTLENCLRVAASGMIDTDKISRSEPLGLVASRAHLWRIRYFTRKVFGMRRGQILSIATDSTDRLSAGLPEPLMYAVTVAAYFGIRRPAAMRRREASLIRLLRRLPGSAASSGR